MQASKSLVIATIVFGACTSPTTKDSSPDAIFGDAAAAVENQDADVGPSEDNSSTHADAQQDSATANSGSIYGGLVLLLFDYSSLFVTATFDYQSSDDVPKGCTETNQGDCRIRTCPENNPEPASKTMWPHAGRIDVSTEEITLPSLLPGEDGKYEPLMEFYSLGIKSRQPARFAAQGHGEIPAFNESVDVPQRIVLSLPKPSMDRSIRISPQNELAFEWLPSTPSRNFGSSPESVGDE